MSQQHAHIFINLPCKSLPASKAFFEALGYHFNPQFTNDSGACLVLGDNLFGMLLTEEFARGFTAKPLVTPRQPPRCWYACPARAAKRLMRWWPRPWRPGAARHGPRKTTASCMPMALKTWTATSGSWSTWQPCRGPAEVVAGAAP